MKRVNLISEISWIRRIELLPVEFVFKETVLLAALLHDSVGERTFDAINQA